MAIRRTVPVKLDVSDSAAESLFATILDFRFAANCAVDRARKENGYVETTKQGLHERTYREVRERVPDLQANLVQTARNRAADALKGVVARWKDGEYAELPTFTADFIDYNKRAATFHDDHVSLSTVDGRIDAEYVLPHEDDLNDTPHGKYLFSGDFNIGGATLHHRDGVFYLHVRTKADVDDTETSEHPTVLGVDLGIDNLAVTSTGGFWSGGLLNHRRNAYEKLRGDLQRTGTESAHRTIQSIGDRESRWAKDLLHNVSKELVAEAIEYKCSAIVFERLNGIRNRMLGAKKFHVWAFNQLYEYVEYKAEAVGIDVTKVPPQYTSQRCSACGHTAKGNRSNGDDEFGCQKCGYELHADYNAAKNIGWKYVRTGQKSRSGRAARQLALKSGTVNANGDFTPAENIGQSGSPPTSTGL
ncbi:RNA-guided endonuclease InsQ/TnpB family protein [Halococcus salsus]|uniref:RNA-guided endonuclease InsQ/TnpB family protein n=1 Tax=Halococcus salsus TaxID=2162894 RepID=UPI001356E9C3|nr:RNA-guided endonuclease TnpB family protein [Halococcus salsus]